MIPEQWDYETDVVSLAVVALDWLRLSKHLRPARVCWSSKLVRN